MSNVVWIVQTGGCGGGPSFVYGVYSQQRDGCVAFVLEDGRTVYVDYGAHCCWTVESAHTTKANACDAYARCGRAYSDGRCDEDAVEPWIIDTSCDEGSGWKKRGALIDAAWEAWRKDTEGGGA